MKTLILFVAYHENEFIDYNYIQELKLISNNIKILSNKHISNLDTDSIIIYNNEGYDFGFWYKALNEYDINLYDRIILVNNSNLLIKGGKLKTLINNYNKNLKYDYWGLTDSYEAPEGINSLHAYHIQSHFLVLEKSVIPYILEFFKDINFEKYFNIQTDLRQKIINNCEIGLTQYFINKGFSVGSVYSIKDLCIKYKMNYTKINPHVMLWEQLIYENYPLIKKKIVNGEWKFLKNYNNYKKYV